MIEWISANYGTIIVCALIIGLVVALSISRLKDKKKGKSCCGGCSGCAMNGSCHTEKKED